jgi:hypothetical protein
MIINQTRVRNIQRFLGTSNYGNTFIVGVKIESLIDPLIFKVGFVDVPRIGDQILPSADNGPISLFNAEGRIIKHHNQKMETAYRQAEWHWKLWDGTPRSDIVDVPYDRYPQSFVEPPSEEVIFGKTSAGNYALLSLPVLYDGESERRLTHIINLFLELAGFCEIFTESLNEMVDAPFKKVNWRILPPGKRPWPQLRQDINQLLDLVTTNRVVIEHRIEVINSYGSEFVAVGQGGFKGYIIFGFPYKNIYICESIYSGNATYVFEENWETLSKMTKAQILNQSLQKDRIIHREGWEKKVHGLFS